MGYQKLKARLVASGILLGLATLAIGAFNDSTQILLDSGFQNLGDEPKPASYPYYVDLSTDLLAKTKTVHLEFKILHASHGRVAINGHMLQIPYSGHLKVWEDGQIGVTIPLAYFHSGRNIVEFSAGKGFWTGTNIFDDYRYGEVVLIFSH